MATLQLNVYHKGVLSTSLAALTGTSSGHSIVITGHTTAGDGAEGLARWDASDSSTADNGGTVWGAGTGRWKRIYSGAVSVLWFGAGGDGSTDSTTPILSALTAAAAAGVKEVLIPASPGAYLVSTVALPDATITITGYGATIQTTAAGSFAFTSAYRKRMTFQGLSFTGVGSGVSQTLSPSGTQSYDAVFEKCSFVLPVSKTGIKLTGSREVTISQCYFETCIGIHLLQAANTHVIGSQFKNCAYGCFGDGSTTGSAYDAGLLLTACTMLGCTYGVRTVGWDHTAIVNSMIDYCDQPVVCTNADGVTIQSTYVSGRAAYPAIKCDSDIITYSGETTKHVIIDACHVIQHYAGATDSVSILIDGCLDVVIAKSEISFWRNYGILVTGTNTHIKVYDNYIAPLSPVGGAKGVYGTGSGDATWEVLGNTFTSGYAVGNTSFCAFERNTNFNLRAQGSVLMLSGNTTLAVTFATALEEAPTRIFLCPRGNIGQPWPTAISTAGMTINIASGAPGDTQVDYDAFVVTT